MNTFFTLLALERLPAATSPVPWRPFLDPMPLAWFDSFIALWLLPLSFAVAFAYKAIRIYDIRPARFAREVAMMTAQIVLGMIALGAASFLLVEVFVPWISAHR